MGDGRPTPSPILPLAYRSPPLGRTFFLSPVFHCLKNSRWKQNFLRCERSHEKISPALQAIQRPDISRTRGDLECVFVFQRTATTNLEDFFSNGSIQMYSFGLVAEIVFPENPHYTHLVVHTAKKDKKIELSKTTHMSSMLCKNA